MAVSADKERHQFVLVSGLIVVLATCVRALYAFGAEVDYPIVGDINQYVLYAWNILHRGVFSTALPDVQPVPDSYRGPGYPLFLALNMWLAGHSDLPLRAGPNGLSALGYASDTWMRFALAGQVALGSATALLTILLARLRLGRGWAILAGFLVALWPHLITFAGTLLSETLFCFTIALSLYLSCAAESRQSLRLAIASGVCFGCAYLVNPIIALFPLLVALMIWLRSQRRTAIALLAAFLVAPGIWAVRSVEAGAGNGSAQRAALNFVVGSIPQYFTAYNSRFDNEISKQIVDFAAEETRLLIADPGAGAAEIAERMRQDPAFYAKWYLVEKPYLLWDWAIRIGSGDIYFLQTRRSPFERIGILRLAERSAEWANPLLFALALGAALWLLWHEARARPPQDLSGAVLAVFFLYVTAVHVVLQAEPRYSIPYRPVEILLAVGAAASILRHAMRWTDRMRPAIPQPGADGTQGKTE